MAFKAVHERWKCIACGACAAVAPDFWEMSNDDGKADLKESVHTNVPEGIKETRILREIGPNKDAADSCPVQCIHVLPEGGKCLSHSDCNP